MSVVGLTVGSVPQERVLRLCSYMFIHVHTVHYSALQCITVHYSALQCITVHYTALQCTENDHMFCMLRRSGQRAHAGTLNQAILREWFLKWIQLVRKLFRG